MLIPLKISTISTFKCLLKFYLNLTYTVQLSQFNGPIPLHQPTLYYQFKQRCCTPAKELRLKGMLHHLKPAIIRLIWACRPYIFQIHIPLKCTVNGQLQTYFPFRLGLEWYTFWWYNTCLTEVRTWWISNVGVVYDDPSYPCLNIYWGYKQRLRHN